MKGMNEWAVEIAEWGIEKGFYCPPDLSKEVSRDLMLGKLCLVHTEISEAAEAVRDEDVVNFAEELADTIIRILHIAGTMNLDMDKAIADKMEKNWKRPYRHGRRVSI